jgi:hypothetical protein
MAPEEFQELRKSLIGSTPGKGFKVVVSKGEFPYLCVTTTWRNALQADWDVKCLI